MPENLWETEMLSCLQFSLKLMYKWCTKVTKKPENTQVPLSSPRNYVTLNKSTYKTWIPSPPLPHGLPLHDHISLPPCPGFPPQLVRRTVLCRAGAALPAVHGRGADVHKHEAAPAAASLPSTPLSVQSAESMGEGQPPSFPTLHCQTELSFHQDGFNFFLMD